MGYDLTVQGLIRKRAELSSQANGLRDQLSASLANLDAIDRVIRVFRPDIDLSDLPEKPTPPALSGTRGDIQRFLLDALRKAEGPLSTFDLADMVMRGRGMDPADKIARKLIAGKTGNGLSKLRKKGLVDSSRAHGNAPLQWRLPNPC
jgi:hypothetical protein